MEFLGVRFLGLTEDNGKKLLLTIGFILFLLLLNYVLQWLAKLVFQSEQYERVLFWTRQGIGLLISLLLVGGILSIWFDDPTRLTTALGLVSAGLAFALQKVVSSIAGYFVILRGKTFWLGDRIMMGGVRGDVVALGFIQTTIMEMGEPASGKSNGAPGGWVKSRQFTGRIVTVANSRVFDEPVYNYTRDFPFIWEEMTIRLPFGEDHERAEQIILDAVRRHTTDASKLDPEPIKRLEEKYLVEIEKDLEPSVFYQLTDKGVELTARFIVHDSDGREIKDPISRDLLKEFRRAGIELNTHSSEKDSDSE
jgi:small-conductance mechanosensitive channel